MQKLSGILTKCVRGVNNVLYFIGLVTWLPQFLSQCNLYMLNIVSAYLFGSLNETLEYFKGLKLRCPEWPKITEDMKTNFTNNNNAYILHYIYLYKHTTADDKLPKRIWEFLPIKGVISKTEMCKTTFTQFFSILFLILPYIISWLPKDKLILYVRETKVLFHLSFGQQQ